MLNFSIATKGAVAERLVSAFRNGCILVYSGEQPDDASQPATGTLLGRITDGGGAWSAGSPDNGLRFIRSGQYLLGDPSQNWVLTGIATGTAGWFRLVGNAADAGGASATHHRLDGSVSTLADPHIGLILPALEITPATSRQVQQFLFTL